MLNNSKIKVLFATSELAPLAKVGGLADVAGSLPPILNRLGVDIRIIIPKYGIIKEKKYQLKKIISNLRVNFEGSGHWVNLYQTTLPNQPTVVYLIDNRHFLGHGGVYLSPEATSRGTKSEFERFNFFSVAILEVLKNLSWQPQIIHCNDWHLGLLPKLIKIKNFKIKTLITIHNLAYQGWYKQQTVLRLLDLKKSFFRPIKHSIITLKEAILDSDIINTVSPSYAKEILTPEFGLGLEKDLQKRKKDLFAILNGIDVDHFNPATDKMIKFNYNPHILDKKTLNKKYLQKICRLPQNEKIPLLSMVGRLTEQKGFELIFEILEDLLKLNIQLVILATGRKNYEEKIATFGKKYPQKLSFHPRFDLKLAQQIYAGADIFLMPSYFEPCGLGQMIAMRYGTIPIVRATGGLKDTVINFQFLPLRGISLPTGDLYDRRETNPKPQTPSSRAKLTRGQANSNPPAGGQNSNGFIFKKYKPLVLYKAIKRALTIYQSYPKAWHKLQVNAMKQDFSWQNSAQKYLKLYKKLVNK